MKAIRKNTVPLLFLLASCLLLSACDLCQSGFFEVQSQEQRDTYNPAESVTNATTVDLQQPYEPQICDLDQALVHELTEYIQSLHGMFDLNEIPFSMKVDQVKRYDQQVFCVKFDAENYYYACAYFNPLHEKPETAPNDLCCVGEYTWVKYDSPNQITETYNGLGFVCAFQINRSLYCVDLSSNNGATQNVEHFKMYTAKFVNGINAETNSFVDKSFVFISHSDDKIAYHSADAYDHEQLTIRCVEKNGKLYIPIFLYAKEEDGTRKENTMLEWELGADYDDIMRVLIYDEFNERGNYYGLLTMEDFSKIIIDEK